MPRPTTIVTVRDQSFKFEQASLRDFPDALLFLGHLLDRGVSPSVAQLYVRSVCRLKRRGTLTGPAIITGNMTEQTAANAYKKWRAEGYTQRSTEVVRALRGAVSLKRIRFLRRHSISAPAAGKLIPVAQLPTAIDLADFIPEPGAPRSHLSIVESGAISNEPAPTIPTAPTSIAWQSAETSWTLHVPHEFAAPHVDPCESCTAFVLDATQLEAIAVAFEKTWGHRDLNALPPESYLFGTPPSESEEEEARKTGERALAIVSPTSTRADDMERISVPIMLDVGAAIERLSAVDGVYLSRAAIGGRLHEVLGALWSAWSVR